MANAKERFRKSLEEAIRYRGITKVELCSKAGISRSQLDAYLKGASTPGLEIAEQIAQALGFDISDFLNPGQPVPKDHSLQECIRRVSEAAWKSIK